MVKVGLREANQHFSKYLKIVREGNEVIVTDRGTPVAVIKPLFDKKRSIEDKIQLLEDQGILKQAVKGGVPLHKLSMVKGKPVSEIIIEERENRD